MENIETIVNKKIEALVKGGADDQSINDYLVKSFELALTRLISQKIDKLSENQYLELEKLVSLKNFGDIEKILKGDELSQKLNGAIFQNELKKVFNM